MTQTKPKPKTDSAKLHYRLTNEEWLQAVHELTSSQKDVLYYLRTLDPFGNQELNLGVRDIANILKTSPSTVSRALKVLDSKGYIDLEIVQAKIKLVSKSTQPEEYMRNDKCCTHATMRL